MAVLLHFFIGAVVTFLVSTLAARKAAESYGSAPAAALIAGITCASLSHFVSPWATPVILGLISLAAIGELRQS